MSYPAVNNRIGASAPHEIVEADGYRAHPSFGAAHKIAIGGKLYVRSADIFKVGGKEYMESPMEIIKIKDVKMEPFRRGIRE